MFISIFLGLSYPQIDNGIKKFSFVITFYFLLNFSIFIYNRAKEDFYFYGLIK